MLKNHIFIQATADVSSLAAIGDGTRIWHHVHIREKATIGKNCTIGKDVYIDAGVVLGNNVKIQNGSYVYREAVIEDDVFIGPRVILTNDKYPRAVNAGWKPGRIHIKKGASLGAGAIVLPDIVIGEYALIAAGSIVTKNIPPHALVKGNPGRTAGTVCYCGRILKRTYQKPNKRFTCIHE